MVNMFRLEMSRARGPFIDHFVNIYNIDLDRLSLRTELSVRLKRINGGHVLV